jgi:hypothetical protein
MRLLPFFALWLVAVSFFLAWAVPQNIAQSLVLFVLTFLFTLTNPFRHAGWAAATIANLIFGYIQISQKGGSTLILSLVVIVEALFYITVWFGNSTRASLAHYRTPRKIHHLPPVRRKEVISQDHSIAQSSFPIPTHVPGESVVAFVGMEIDQIGQVKEALCKKLNSDSIRLLFFSEGVTAFAIVAEANYLAQQLVHVKDIPIERVVVNNDWVEVDLI